MTEYHLFPPIRFQFEGHAETARSGIPQARTLMQQMIRRMEIGEVEALCWRVNTADGMYFEVHKYGDQHIALIRAPEIPIVPEAGKGKKSGGFLWIGARNVIDEEFLGDIAANLPPTNFGAGVFGGDGYWGSPIHINDITNEYTYPGEKWMEIALPIINLMLFEPTWNTAGGSVAQSALATMYSEYPTTYAYPLMYIPETASYGDLGPFPEDFSAWPDYGQGNYNKQLTIANHKYQIPGRFVYITPDESRDEETRPTKRNWPFVEARLSTPNQCFTSAPYLYVPSGFNGKCHSYLLLDASQGGNVNSYKIEDTYEVEGITTYFRTSGLYNNTHDFSYGYFYTKTGFPEEDTIKYTDLYMEEKLDAYQYFLPPPLPATENTNILDGLYELRVSIGENAIPKQYNPSQDYEFWFNPDYSFTFYTNITPYRLEIFIQNGAGTDIQTYPIEINPDFDALDNPTEPMTSETSSFLFKKEQYDSGQIPTKAFGWYDGCWLIDIKQGTIIHETNPDKLSRDWLV